jgi:polysaccharide pyruvyl transferase WcaK-like protein
MSYTYEVETTFENEFAKALTEFNNSLTEKPVFVFFPMNAIQFGMSDLRSAHRILKHVGPDVDFRLWEADASLDGVVALIRRLDAVVSMRFHATIFALSQGCPVAGIDYRIGKRDKVAAVLSDAGHEEDCCRIDELTAPWLTEKLRELLARPRLTGSEA